MGGRGTPGGGRGLKGMVLLLVVMTRGRLWMGFAVWW